MILILEVFKKKTCKTPKSIIDVCKQRIKIYAKDRGTQIETLTYHR